MVKTDSYENDKQALIDAGQQLIDAALHSSLLTESKKISFRRALRLIKEWPAIKVGNDLIIGVESIDEGDYFDEMDTIEFIINERSLTLLAGGFVVDHYVSSQPIIEPELVVDIDGNKKNFDLMPVRLKLLKRILKNTPTFYIKQKRKKNTTKNTKDTKDTKFKNLI